MYEKTKWNRMKKICTLQKLTQKEVSIAILILDKKKKMNSQKALLEINLNI